MREGEGSRQEGGQMREEGEQDKEEERGSKDELRGRRAPSPSALLFHRSSVVLVCLFGGFVFDCWWLLFLVVRGFPQD
jgi:hypothetical protein